MEKLILVDGNSILFRAYYATAYPGATLMQTSKRNIQTRTFCVCKYVSKNSNKQMENMS